MKTLHITITREWFDKIASGEKTEEYRMIKDYWSKRLFSFVDGPYYTFKTYDLVKLTNGYGKHRPILTARCTGIRITGADEQTDLGTGRFFAIGIGEIVSKENV